MIKLIKLEFLKLKRKKIGLSILLLLFGELIWSLWAASSYTDTYNGWCYLLYQIPTINTLLMPILIAILTSRLSDNEYKGDTFKLLCTMIDAPKLYISKLICASIYLICTAFGQVLCMLVTSQLVSFTDPLPFGHLTSYILTTMLVNLCLLVFYQTVSLLFANQAITLIAGIAGGFMGLFSVFFPPTIQRFFLPSYYSILDTISMITHTETQTFSIIYDSLDIVSLLVVVIVTIGLYILGQMSFCKKEI